MDQIGLCMFFVAEVAAHVTAGVILAWITSRTKT